MAELKHIVRIAKVDVPGGKQVRFALTKIKGVGKNLAHAVCNLAKIDNQLKAGALNEAQIKTLSDILENLKDGKVPTWMLNRRRDYDTGEDKHALIGTLDFAVDNDIKRLRKIKSYKGVRHSKKLPVRGQRTKSNFRRNKGKVVGVKKKK